LRRNLIALNLLLLALIGLTAWQMRVQYLEKLRRQEMFLRAPAPAAPPPVVLLPPPPGQISAATYLDIATKLPFSKDRNPNVVIEVVAPKPMPPLPRYYGLMNFGTPRVILALASGQPQKSYAVGDVVGEFKLAGIAQSGLIFDWEGKQVPAAYSEIQDRSTTPPASASSSAPASAPASGVKTVSNVTSVSSADLARPGADSGAGIRNCQVGDNTPAGAVVDGYRKLVTDTPFGKSCRWEKVN
jgi:hypothetical protein